MYEETGRRIAEALEGIDASLKSALPLLEQLANPAITAEDFRRQVEAIVGDLPMFPMPHMDYNLREGGKPDA